LARPLWYVNILKKTFPNIKFIAKLTRIPILGKIFDLAIFEGDDIIYLAQDKVIPINKEIQKESDIVLPSQVLEYFINKANYHWIMNFCICRDSMHCKDYPINLGCLFLGKAVLGINPLLGRLVSKEEALEHVKECRDAGLVHMIGRNKLDASWLNVKPGNKLLSICNCCPCCCLWRILPKLAPQIGKKIKKMTGVKIRVNDDCIGCGTCMKGICFVDAIQMVNEHAVINEECRGCGRCVEVCPQNAIELTIDDELFVKKSIEQIEKLVDVT
jgi:ferredoxin